VAADVSELEGMNRDHAAYYSSIFTIAGVAGAILAGYAMDRLFRSRWELICLLMGFGMVAGYLAVLNFGAHPICWPVVLVSWVSCCTARTHC